MILGLGSLIASWLAPRFGAVLAASIGAGSQLAAELARSQVWSCIRSQYWSWLAASLGAALADFEPMSRRELLDHGRDLSASTITSTSSTNPHQAAGRLPRPRRHLPCGRWTSIMAAFSIVRCPGEDFRCNGVVCGVCVPHGTECLHIFDVGVHLVSVSKKCKKADDQSSLTSVSFSSGNLL